MQTREGSRAFARGLLLFPFLFSCASVEPTSEVEETEDALRTRMRDVIFSDDFECGWLGSPMWSSRGEVNVRADAAHRGAFGVELGTQAVLVGQLDTRGRKRLTLAFTARAQGLDGHEMLRVELAVGDHAFHPIAQVRACDWSRHTVALPRFAEDRALVRVRFVVPASGGRWRHGPWAEAEHGNRHGPKHGHGHAVDEVQLDDIVISAAAEEDCDIDAGPVDAATPDADVRDGASLDAALADAGLAEAGLPDAAVSDASTSDSAVADAGAPDAGPCTTDLGCSDGNACNGAETCEAGRCVAGTAPSCDDGQVCTVDRCDPAGGCISQPGLGLPCDGDGVCDAQGACAECVPPVNTYDAIQLRIFDSPRYLCTSCHRTGGRLIDLTASNSYAVLLGQTGARPDVVPGIPETSILYDRLRAKVEGTPPLLGGNPMPRGNAPAITRAELDAIAAWISAGAPRTGVVPGTATTLCVPPSLSVEAEQ